MKETMRTTLMREIVRDFMEDHLGATPKQIVYGTGLSTQQVGRAYRSIRKEWMARFERAAPGSTRYGINHRLRAIDSSYALALIVPAPEPMSSMLQYNPKGEKMTIRVGDNKTPIGAVVPSGLVERLKELGGIMNQTWPVWYLEATRDHKPGMPAPWQLMMLSAAKEIEQLQELAGRYHKQLYG